MTTSPAVSPSSAAETCQSRRRAAKMVTMLKRADALVRRANSTSGARSSRLLREANTIRVVEADAKRIREMAQP